MTISFRRLITWIINYNHIEQEEKKIVDYVIEKIKTKSISIDGDICKIINDEILTSYNIEELQNK